MKIKDLEKAMPRGVEIDEIRCKEGEVIICRAHQGTHKLVYDDEGRAFVRGRRVKFWDLNLNEI